MKYQNALVAGFSYLTGSITGRPLIMGMPPAVSMELTNHCNLKCPECVSGAGLLTRTRGFMDRVLYRKVLAELDPYIFNLNLWFQGEPMLHPDFFSFLELKSRCRKIVSTNGQFISEENARKIVETGLTKLIISLDGFDQKTYEAYRKGAELIRVTEGIRNVSRAKLQYRSSLKIEIQFLVNRKNEHQISIARKFASDAGVTLRLKSMQVINPDMYEEWLPDSKRFRRYEKKEGVWEIRNRLPNRCSRLWFNPVVTWDGKVVPCCFDKNAEHIMGDLTKQSFREIWEGSKYSDFRRAILSRRSEIEICRNCTSGLKINFS